jgi:hypothetical protein
MQKLLTNKQDIELLDRIDLMMDQLFCPPYIKLSDTLFEGRLNDGDILTKGRREYTICSSEDMHIGTPDYTIKDFYALEILNRKMDALHVLIGGVTAELAELIDPEPGIDLSGQYNLFIKNVPLFKKGGPYEGI